MLIGFVAGLVAGLVAYLTSADAEWVQAVTRYVTTPFSTIFLNLIFMLIVPLIFSALIMGVSEMGDIRALGRIGWKTLVATVVLSGIAVLLGLVMVNVFKPGVGVDPVLAQQLLALQPHGLLEQALHLIERAAQAVLAEQLAAALVHALERLGKERLGLGQVGGRPEARGSRVAAEVREEAGGAPFSMFDYTPVGAAVAVAGVLLLVLGGWKLVPVRREAAAEGFDPGAYLTELRVPEGARAVGKTVRVLVTGADVIHAFALPAFGLKVDAIPGRVNETWFRAEKEGVYYGQCSELCGINHAYMPIVVKAVSQEKYDAWLAEAKTTMSADASSHLPAAPVRLAQAN